WQARDTVLHYDGKGQALRTEKKHGDCEIIADFRFPAKTDGKPAPCTFIFREAEGRDAGVTISPDGTVKTSTGRGNRVSQGRDPRFQGSQRRGKVEPAPGNAEREVTEGDDQRERCRRDERPGGGDVRAAARGRDGLRQPVRARVEVIV